MRDCAAFPLELSNHKILVSFSKIVPKMISYLLINVYKVLTKYFVYKHS